MPKFGLDLMKCEIDRLLLLTRNSVYPLPYFVPRRSYYDFHAEVFPDTYNTSEPGLDKTEWLNGTNADAKKTALNPDNQKRFFASETLADAVVTSTTTTTIIVSTPSMIIPEPAPVSVSSVTIKLNKEGVHNEPVTSKSNEPESLINNEKPVVVFRTTKPEDSNGHLNGNGKTNGSNGTTTKLNIGGDRKTKAKSVYYQSKFKYIDGKAAHKTEHITNIRNLSTMWPSECNGFQVNTRVSYCVEIKD